MSIIAVTKKARQDMGIYQNVRTQKERINWKLIKWKLTESKFYLNPD
jgi:hypothetical protein